MKSAVEENIDALSRAIMSEAQAEADRILAEAREKAQAVIQQAQQQADQERKVILAKAKEEADRLRGQAVATTQLKARTMQLDHREKLLDEVFHTAQAEIASIQQWTDYPEIVGELVREAISQLRADEVIVRADPQTQKLLNDSFLQKVSQNQNIKIQVGEPLEKGIGIVAQTLDGHLQFDNTLETRLHRMRNELRASTYQLLMGEAV